jgi:hypothetical protein
MKKKAKRKEAEEGILGLIHIVNDMGGSIMEEGE